MLIESLLNDIVVVCEIRHTTSAFSFNGLVFSCFHLVTKDFGKLRKALRVTFWG